MVEFASTSSHVRFYCCFIIQVAVRATRATSVRNLAMIIVQMTTVASVEIVSQFVNDEEAEADIALIKRVASIVSHGANNAVKCELTW